MNKIKLLDCTLRDGGYVNDWDFSVGQISSAIQNLTNAGIDYVEIGYLTSILGNVRGTQFQDVESASSFLPKDRENTHTKYVIMADVSQFDADKLCDRTSKTLDGIRAVFYKRQIEQAFSFCEKICKKGFDLFLQPMVTVDYSPLEFSELVSRFYAKHRPYAISIVDSFGCMNATELNGFINILESRTDKELKIGFHGHDNMQLSQVNAISLFDYSSGREFIVDASVGGIGRGAGNLHTELIANYFNLQNGAKYDLDSVLMVASEVTEPLSREYKWGYSPYFMLTAMRRAHPNYATYLLANHRVSVREFADYIRSVPDAMLTKCTRPYVEESYRQFTERAARR
jgi:4-hydroxy 2-oxovalerate aldolase